VHKGNPDVARRIDRPNHMFLSWPGLFSFSLKLPSSSCGKEAKSSSVGLSHGLQGKIPGSKNDELVKNRNSIEFVIPAKLVPAGFKPGAGIQLFQDVLDPGFRRGDAPRDFLRDHQEWREKRRGKFFDERILSPDGESVYCRLPSRQL